MIAWRRVTIKPQAIRSGLIWRSFVNKKREVPLTRAEIIAIIRAGQASFAEIPHACTEAVLGERVASLTMKSVRHRLLEASSVQETTRPRELPLFDWVDDPLAVYRGRAE